jgi:hypothetical protein
VSALWQERRRRAVDPFCRSLEDLEPSSALALRSTIRHAAK